MTVAIYHVLLAEETFEPAAHVILEMVNKAQDADPGKPRALFLDVDAHRNEAGGYDDEAYELQMWVLRFLLPYLSEVYIPLFHAENPYFQKNLVPGRLIVIPDEEDLKEP